MKETETLEWLYQDDRRYWFNTIIELNPCLKDYDFHKMIDPFSCYQAISMYLGGVLTKKEPVMLNIKD